MDVYIYIYIYIYIENTHIGHMHIHIHKNMHIQYTVDGAKQNYIRNTGKWAQIVFHISLNIYERCSVINKTNRGVMFFTQSHSVSYDCHVDWPWLQGPSPRDCGRGAPNLWLKSSKDSDIKGLEVMQAWRHKHYFHSHTHICEWCKYIFNIGGYVYIWNVCGLVSEVFGYWGFEL